MKANPCEPVAQRKCGALGNSFGFAAPAASDKRAGLAFVIAANDRAGGSDREASFFERPDDE